MSLRAVERVTGGVVAVLLLVAGCASSGVATPKQDAPARLPDLTLAAFQEGDPLDLRALRGPAVVNLWASWCPPCRRELPLYQAFAQKYDGQVKVIGVDFQETRDDRAQALIRRTGVRYPLFSDPDGKLRANALPKVLLVDEDGRVAYEAYVEITSLAQLEKLVDQHLGGA